MMAKKTSDRFPSMTAVAEELYAILKSPAAEPIAAEKAPTASRPSAAPAPSRGDAATSQIRKSVKQKALTESDMSSLEELVRKCARRRDYDQMIQIIERVPEHRRSEALQNLLEKAREKLDEIAFLICEIDEADRLNDRQTALKKAEELLKLKPGNHRAKQIEEKYSGYGDGGAARIGLATQFTKPWNDGGWIPWSALAFGLAVFAVMCGVIVIYLNKTTVVIDVKDSGISVAIADQGKKIEIVTGPREGKVEVEPGEQQLKITYAGLQTMTKSFTLKRGDKKTVTVSLADAKLIAKLGNDILVEQDVKPPPAGPGVKPPQGVAQSPRDEKQTETPGTTASADPDRRAAEWVLSIGGTIKINESGNERDIKPGGELPRGPFELTIIDLSGNQKVTTAGLAHFKDCNNLTRLGLPNTQVSDAGLVYFKGCNNLTSLYLGGTQVTDAGLAYFKDCKYLTILDVGGTRVSDAGLAYFNDCKNLTSLAFGGATKVSDAGLVYFKDRNNLTTLYLGGTRVSDAGLAYFKDCKYLTILDLGGAHVSDAGLVYFKDCKNLTTLYLGGTRVSDAGLAYFKDCKYLTILDLGGAHVSDAGLAYFKNCKNLAHLQLAVYPGERCGPAIL